MNIVKIAALFLIAFFSAAGLAFGYSTYASAPVTGTCNNILVLLVDFSDRPGTVSPSDIGRFCNEQNTTVFGNKGSVRDYYYEVSNGKLELNFNVMPYYYRAQQPSTYYGAMSYSTAANTLIIEALNHLESTGFDFSTVSRHPWTNKFFIGMMYAGGYDLITNHKDTFNFSADGVSGENYFTVAVTSSPDLGIFAHELGHALPMWPDLYDYTMQSYSLGMYCLMAHNSDDQNPVPPSPYLRDISGWETVHEISPAAHCLSVTIAANSYTSYVFKNPARPTELFYIEARNRTGKSTSYFGSGVMIWHVDEAMGYNSGRHLMTPANHYMVSLEQADGLYQLENKTSLGDGADFYDGMNKWQFDDTTSPSSKWWDGSASGLSVSVDGWENGAMKVTFMRDASCIPPTPTPMETPVPAPCSPCVPPCPGSSWEQTAAGAFLNTGGASLVSHDSKLWFIGGSSKRAVWNSMDGVNWTEVTPAAPFPYMANNTVSLNSKLFYVGENGAVLSSIDGASWITETASAGFGVRSGFACAVYGGFIWVVGGYVHPSQLSDVWKSQDGKNWQRLTNSASFPARSLAAMTSHNGKLYLANGYTGMTYFNDVWSTMDGYTWICETASAPYAARRDSGLLSYNGYLYVIGGNSITSTYADVWSSCDGIYWTQAASSAEFGARQISAAVFDNRLWVAGGVGTGNVWRSIAAITPTPSTTGSTTPVNTFTPTPTNTPTQEPSPSYTQTPEPSATTIASATSTNSIEPSATITVTLSQTATYIITATTTPTLTSTIPPQNNGVLTISKPLTFPNPFIAAFNTGGLNVKFVTNKDTGWSKIKIYTRAFRLVLISQQGANGAGEVFMNIPACDFANFSPGLYYYCIEALGPEAKTARSPLQNMLILK